jgi:S1-C subfamily serine protease
MTSPFDGFEVERSLRPSARELEFDLNRSLASVMVLHARVPPDAFTARTLGVERLGNGILIGQNGLVLTIGYLITEAEEVTLITNAGRRVPAHGLGADPVTGLGLVQALEPLDLPALSLGNSRSLQPDDPIILAGGGGAAHAMAGHFIDRALFAGYWEYLLEDALFTGPGHPHWSGAALIGPTGALLGVSSLQMTQLSSSGGSSLINMSVPIELLPPILDDLASGRPAREPRPWLGVLCQDSGETVVIAGVSDGGPAARAQIRQSDIILAVGGQPVTDLSSFYKKLWSLGPAGVVAPLTLSREGDVFDLEVRTLDRAAMLKKRRLN